MLRIDHELCKLDKAAVCVLVVQDRLEEDGHLEWGSELAEDTSRARNCAGLRAFNFPFSSRGPGAAGTDSRSASQKEMNAESGLEWDAMLLIGAAREGECAGMLWTGYTETYRYTCSISSPAVLLDPPQRGRSTRTRGGVARAPFGLGSVSDNMSTRTRSGTQPPSQLRPTTTAEAGAAEHMRRVPLRVYVHLLRAVDTRTKQGTKQKGTQVASTQWATQPHRPGPACAGRFFSRPSILLASFPLPLPLPLIPRSQWRVYKKSGCCALMGVVVAEVEEWLVKEVDVDVDVEPEPEPELALVLPKDADAEPEPLPNDAGPLLNEGGAGGEGTWRRCTSASSASTRTRSA
ncbi:hypothetical protein B0H10DRAFT_2204354 [Mycena sp. CBHHK59/15]|nr:hypothetical protein B0H10DRAFT_2204354 [Mycena sp. CBHHK59/15]